MEKPEEALSPRPANPRAPLFFFFLRKHKDVFWEGVRGPLGTFVFVLCFGLVNFGCIWTFGKRSAELPPNAVLVSCRPRIELQPPAEL